MGLSDLPIPSTTELDRTYNWHPFTPIDDWLDPGFTPVSIVGAQGSELYAEDGQTYLDGNSSIWTITHGHRHPHLVAALKKQADTLEHASFLGLTHPWSGRLAQGLAEMAGGHYRTFFSDDGSTAMEAALKIVWQYFQQNGQPDRRVFLSLSQGYHGDTVGAMSLGQSRGFHGIFSPLLFPSAELPAPACYRCPYNRASPQRRDAREYRDCGFECASRAVEIIRNHGDRLAAVVIEPRVQGAAGMWMHPPGYLPRIAEAVQAVGARLVLDEVFTGFGRTGHMLAAQADAVSADLIVLGKGLTGGMLPMGATLIREDLFTGFRGSWDRTFFHGHSYSANPLGCAVSLANLEVFEQEGTLDRIHHLSNKLRLLSQIFWKHPQVGDVRQEGLILAIELVQDVPTRRPYPSSDRVAFQVSEAARNLGLLTRGIGNVLILVPPYGTSESQLEVMVDALFQALEASTLPN